MEKIIYFDNNATTMMEPKTIKSMLNWINRGNPSSSYTSAIAARKMMTQFRQFIAKICKFSDCCEEPRNAADQEARGKIEEDLQNPTKYRIIFTSGASESNCSLVASVAGAYKLQMAQQPHIICSAVEHKSILLLVEDLQAKGLIELTLVQPTITGHIIAEEVAKCIRQNTCLICIMHANNETGAINDIAKIGKYAHAANVPFFTDVVQSFGKYPINPLTAHVDAFSISFHKFGGPPGVGALVIKQQFLNGYKLGPLIYGTQQGGLRGGTENLPGIGAAFTAMQITMDNRAAKNARVLKIKRYIMTEMTKIFPCCSYVDYMKFSRIPGPKNAAEIVFLSSPDANYLHNTILLSIVKRGGDPMCNTKFKNELEKAGIIISIGSACNTASPKASHVLFAMSVDDLIRKGALRISLGDNNTIDEAKKFIQQFFIILQDFI